MFILSSGQWTLFLLLLPTVPLGRKHFPLVLGMVADLRPH
jgi:hypothetical protein